jgi:replication factor C large subunit
LKYGAGVIIILILSQLNYIMSQLFTDKYIPQNFDEFIGNTEIVDFAKSWAENWSKEKKPLLLFGPAGIGKTSLAYLIAKEFDWQIFEMNASDLRNKDNIEKVMGAASNNSSLFETKRLVLIDEVDSLQSQDRGGGSAIASIVKEACNPIILTANDIYKDKKLLPLRSLTELKEFKKINYLSIAKRLREVCEKENISYDEEAIKELAKNSGGDFRGSLLDIQSLSPEVTMENVKTIGQRLKKEKIFPVVTKIFKGHKLEEIQQVVFNSEVSSDLLMRWVEENIPRQFDETDSAKAFHYLSRGDIFQGRIFNRQHYGFLKYVYFLSTTAVGLSREKDYTGWKPFQFPTLLKSLSASTAKRNLRKKVSKKIGTKTHTSIREGMQDLPFIQTLFENKDLSPSLTHFFEFDEDELAFILNTKKTTKKVKKLLEESKEIEKKAIIENTKRGQTKLF